jgi:hypothetical protein
LPHNVPQTLPLSPSRDLGMSRYSARVPAHPAAAVVKLLHTPAKAKNDHGHNNCN